MARSFIRSTIYQAWLVVALLIVLFALYIALGRQFMPAIGHYREDIQRFISVQWGVRTELGSLAGSWDGYEPTLELSDLQVFVSATDEEPAFRIGRLSVTFDSLRSLVRRNAVFRNVQISGLQLHFTETPQGWKLPGMSPMAGEGGGPAAAAGPVRWVLAQSKAEITDSKVVLKPLGREPIGFSDIRLAIYNRLQDHRVEGSLQLLGDAGGVTLQLRGEGAGDPFDVADFFADFHLRVVDAKLERALFREQLPVLHIASLEGEAEFWAYWRDGRLDFLIGRASLPRSTWVAGGNRLRIPIEDASARLVWRASGSGHWSVVLDDIRFSWADHQSHISKIRLLSEPEDRSLHITSDRLALGPFNRFLLGTGVLPEKLSTVLKDLSPSGDLTNIQIRLAQDPSSTPRFRLRANLQDVGASAWGHAPALSRIDGYLESTERRGFVDLDTRDTLLEFPRLYPQGWQLERARGRIGWSIDLPQIHVRSGLLDLKPPGAELRGRFSLQLPQDERGPEMSLVLGIPAADGRQTGTFLPSRVMPDGVTNWLTGAVEQGTVRNGGYIYHGALGARTERNHSSILYFDVDGGRFRFLPDWPAVRGLKALVVGDARAYRVRIDEGRLLDSRISGGTVTLPRAGDYPLIRVKTEVQQNLPALMRLLRDTPLRENTPALLDTWSVAGGAATSLDLRVHLAAEVRVDANAAVRLRQAKLTIPQGPKPLRFSGIDGRVRWSSGKGLQARALKTRFLDHDGVVEVRTTSAAGDAAETRIELASRADLSAVQELVGSPILSFAEGGLSYRAELKVPYGGAQPSLEIQSDLQDVRIAMPAPLRKQPGTTLPTRVRIQFGEVEDHLSLNLEGLLKGRIYQKNGLVSRGILSFGAEEILEMPVAGLRLGGRLQRLDFGEWQAFLPTLNKRLAGAVEGGSTEALVRNMEFDFDELLLFGYNMPKTHVLMNRMPQHWKLDLRNEFLSLDAELPHNERQPLDLHLRYLRLPDTRKTTPGDPLADVDPRKLPPLDVKIDEFTLGGRPLGNWQFQARPNMQGMQVGGISGYMRATRFEKGHIDWSQAAGVHHTSGSVTARAENMKDVLMAWGFEPTLDSKEARFIANIHWPASPAAFDLAKAEGRLSAKIEDGRFIEAQGAGLLRVFGILNINNIARRLRLDFSDLFKKGLSYDKIEGNYRLAGGVLSSEGTLDIIGPSNKFYVSGDVDLLNERLDQTMTLTVPLTSNLPFAALIAGAPYLAGAIFLTEKLLGDRLERFASAQYSIRGPWAEPEIKLEKLFSEKD